MVSLSFSWAQQLVRLQILIWNYFCAPGVKPRSGHLFHQRRKFLRMTITDAINPHNSNQGFLSKLGRSNSLFPWWGEGGCREAGGGGVEDTNTFCVSGKFLVQFWNIFQQKTPTLSQISSTPTCCVCEVFGAFSSLPLLSPFEVSKQPSAEVGDHGQCWMWSYCITADFSKWPLI